MLVNRRAFCLTAAAGLSVELSDARAGAGAMTAIVARALIAAVIYDKRCSQGRDFADRFRRRGGVVFAVEGDSIGLWYGDLGKSIARTGGSVAGLTSRADFVVARSCGRELALRCVFEERLRVGEQLRMARANRAASGAKFLDACPWDARGPTAASRAPQPYGLRDGDDPSALERGKTVLSMAPIFLTAWLLEGRTPSARVAAS